VELHIKNGPIELNLSLSSEEQETAQCLLYELAQTGVLGVPSVRPVRPSRPELSYFVPSVLPQIAPSRPEPSAVLDASFTVPSRPVLPESAVPETSETPPSLGPRWGLIAVLLGVTIGLSVLSLKFQAQKPIQTPAPVVSPLPSLRTVPMQKP
jgi:hypothetical protein